MVIKFWPSLWTCGKWSSTINFWDTRNVQTNLGLPSAKFLALNAHSSRISHWLMLEPPINEVVETTNRVVWICDVPLELVHSPHPNLVSRTNIIVINRHPGTLRLLCSGHCWTSTASSRSQWALLDLHCWTSTWDLRSQVATVDLHPEPPEPSGHCWTSTAR